MLKLNKKVEYGLMSLKYMHEKADLCSASEVSSHYHIPFDATARVLQKFAAKKWIESVQGVQGGYRLLSSLSDISLVDLVESIEGQQALVKCLLEGHECPLESACEIQGPLQVLDAKVKSFLSDLTVYDLVHPVAKEVLRESV